MVGCGHVIGSMAWTQLDAADEGALADDAMAQVKGSRVPESAHRSEPFNNQKYPTWTGIEKK